MHHQQLQNKHIILKFKLSVNIRYGHKSILQENQFCHQYDKLVLVLMLNKHIITKLKPSVNTRWTQIDLAKESILSSIGSTSVGTYAKQTHYHQIKAKCQH